MEAEKEMSCYFFPKLNPEKLSIHPHALLFLSHVRSEKILKLVEQLNLIPVIG